MYRYIIKRVLLVIPTLLGAAALVFVLMRMVPGDVCVVRLGSSGGTLLSSAARTSANDFVDSIRMCPTPMVRVVTRAPEVPGPASALMDPSTLPRQRSPSTRMRLCDAPPVQFERTLTHRRGN